jgi:hypothetical protein
MNLPDGITGRQWLHSKVLEFRKGINSQDHETCIRLATMFHTFFDNPILDLPNASPDLAGIFEYTALVLKGISMSSESHSFTSRAEAIRQALARRNQDPEFTELLLNPLPFDPVLADDQKFEVLLRELIPAIWHLLQRPRQSLPFAPSIEATRMCAVHGSEVLWALDLQSDYKDKHGFTGYEHFERVAMNPQQISEGDRYRTHVLCRGVLRISYQQQDKKVPTRTLIGWYYAQITQIG